jgi:DNA-binding transcriptional MerR regulator
MAKKDYLQIGEFAHACDVSVQTLRYYEKVKLLKPDYVDEDTGYRYYSKDKIFKLTTINLLKSAGFKLSEVSDILEKESIPDITKLYDFKINELRKEISRIQNKKEQLSCYLDYFNSLLTTNDLYLNKETDNIKVIDTQKENVVFIKDNLTFDYPSMMFLYNRLLKLIFDNKLSVKKPLISTFYSDYKNMYHKTVEVELSMSLLNITEGLSCIKSIPETKSLSAFHKGKYPSSVIIYDKMLMFASDNNLEVTGKITHRLIIPIAAVSNPDETVFEIRLPIKNKNI